MLASTTEPGSGNFTFNCMRTVWMGWRKEKCALSPANRSLTARTLGLGAGT